MKHPALLLVPLLLAAMPVSTAAADPINIVKNPGFEDGQANWRTNAGSFYDWSRLELYAHSGVGSVRSDCSPQTCLGANGYGFYQDLSTVAGESYDLSFWLGNLTGEGLYQVWWGGNMVAEHGIARGTEEFVFYDDLLARSSQTRLWITGGTTGSYLSFDDFSVTLAGTTPSPGPVAAVPEPGTYGMMLAGIGVLGYVARRRRS